MALKSTIHLKERLRAVARGEREVAAVTGTAKVLIALAVFTAAFFLVDWLFVLSVAARAVLLIGGLAAAAWVAKTELYDPLRRRRDEITTALEIERRFPDLRDRLISVVQLTDANVDVSPALLERLEVETAQMTAPLHFTDVIDWRFLRKILLIALLIVVAGVASSVAFPHYVSATFRRMFFGNVRYPSLTQIAVKEVSRRIEQGTDWRIEVALAGKIPSSVTLKMRAAPEARKPKAAHALGKEGAASGGSKWVSVPIKPIIGYTYGVTIEKVQESFDFQVFAGDAWTEPMDVKVLVPVEVLDPVLDVRPPEYSGLAPLVGAPLVGAQVLEGSTVTVKAPMTKPIVSAALLVAGEAPLPLQPRDKDGFAVGTFRVLCAGESSTVARAAFPARNGAVTFTLQAKDVDGLVNREPRVLYALRVQSDRTPRVKILSPRDDRLSVPFAEWKIAYEADDDFGLRKAWLAWDVFETESLAAGSSSSGDTAQTLKPLRSGRVTTHVDQDSRQWRGTAALDMVAAKTAPGETLIAWIEMADARETAAPGTAIGKSQPLRFNIVDENDKWVEIQGRLQSIEESVIHLHDRQENVKKEVDSMRKPR
jgi:hypothetical protein